MAFSAPQEKEHYPYTIIIESEKLPFQNVQNQNELEKKTADKAISDFI